MVGTFFSVTAFAALTTHSLQEPVTIAATVGSSANVLMLRNDAVGSKRLSWIRSTSRLPPSSPDALICSIMSCSARAYAVSVAELDARSAPMTTSVVSPDASSEEQPASPAAKSVDATTDAVRRRESLTGGASSRGKGGVPSATLSAVDGMNTDTGSVRSRQTLPT